VPDQNDEGVVFRASIFSAPIHHCTQSHSNCCAALHTLMYCTPRIHPRRVSLPVTGRLKGAGGRRVRHLKQASAGRINSPALQATQLGYAGLSHCVACKQRGGEAPTNASHAAAYRHNTPHVHTHAADH
jgi:hypothetical protein